MLLNCPHCSARFSAWRKLTVGPLFPRRCKSCGALVTLAHGPYWLASIPWLIGLMIAVVAAHEFGSALRWSALFIGSALSLVLILRYVPFVTRGAAAA